MMFWEGLCQQPRWLLKTGLVVGLLVVFIAVAEGTAGWIVFGSAAAIVCMAALWKKEE